MAKKGKKSKGKKSSSITEAAEAVRRDARKPCFFKIFLPGLCTEHLTIPPLFVKHIVEARPPEMVSLKVPGDWEEWLVGLAEVSGAHGGKKRLAFVEGWKQFVAHHSIDYGDVLVFRLDGELRFSVMLFDKSACEKAVDISPPESGGCGGDDPESKKRKLVVDPGSSDSIDNSIPKASGKHESSRPKKTGIGATLKLTGVPRRSARLSSMNKTDDAPPPEERSEEGKEQQADPSKPPRKNDNLRPNKGTCTPLMLMGVLRRSPRFSSPEEIICARLLGSPLP